MSPRKLRPADGIHLLSINGQLTSLHVRVCTSFNSRLVGWGRGPVEASDSTPLSAVRGVWLQPCNSIHTLWTRCPIDVAFIDVAGRISRICNAVRPHRVRTCSGADSVLELQMGALSTWGLVPGISVAAVRVR